MSNDGNECEEGLERTWVTGRHTEADCRPQRDHRTQLRGLCFGLGVEEESDLLEETARQPAAVGSQQPEVRRPLPAPRRVFGELEAADGS